MYIWSSYRVLTTDSVLYVVLIVQYRSRVHGEGRYIGCLPTGGFRGILLLYIVQCIKDCSNTEIDTMLLFPNQ